MDRYTCSLIRELQGLGLDLFFFHRAKEEVYRQHLEPYGQIFGLCDLFGLDWEQRALPSALVKFGCSIYHAPAERGIPFISPCPRVYSLHSVTEYSYASMIQDGKLSGSLKDFLGYIPNFDSVRAIYWRMGARCAEHILTPSEFSKREIVRFLKIEETAISVTPLAPDPEFLSTPAGKPFVPPAAGIRQPYLLHVGGYESHKNIEGLLRVFSQIKPQWPEIQLVVVGSRPPSLALVELVARLGLALQKDVFLLDGLTNELPQLYEYAHLFVSLSWRESFGLPYLEALCRGTPVVASSWGATSEVVGPGGEPVDPQNEAQACEAMLSFRDLDKRAKFSRAGLTHASRFSWKSTAQATLRTYEMLLQNR